MRLVCGHLTLDAPEGLGGRLLLYSGAIALASRRPDILFPVEGDDGMTHQNAGFTAWVEGAVVRVELPDGKQFIFQAREASARVGKVGTA